MLGCRCGRVWLSVTEREGEGEGTPLMMSRRLSRSLSLFFSFFLAACQKTNLSFFFPSACFLFVLFTHLSQTIPPWSPRLPFHLPAPFFCYLQIFRVSSKAEGRGCFEQTGSCIDIQITLLGEMRRAIVSHPWCVNFNSHIPPPPQHFARMK